MGDDWGDYRGDLLRIYSSNGTEAERRQAEEAWWSGCLERWKYLDGGVGLSTASAEALASSPSMSVEDEFIDGLRYLRDLCRMNPEIRDKVPYGLRVLVDEIALLEI